MDPIHTVLRHLIDVIPELILSYPLMRVVAIACHEINKYIYSTYEYEKNVVNYDQLFDLIAVS